MNTEERNAIISKRVNEWFEKHPQPGICDLVISIIEEIEASRDSRTLSAVPSELLEKLEELSKIVPIPPKAITYENGVEIVDFVQDTIMPEYYNWIKRSIAG